MNNFKRNQNWIIYALITTISWGVWGALIEIPEKNGFPPTLGYITWSLTMIPCAIIALHLNGWQLNFDRKSILMGMFVGISGAGGQIMLFQALQKGPAYLIFPIISLYPILTIILSKIILKESANQKQTTGIAIALIAIFLLSYSDNNDTNNNSGLLWLALSSLVFIAWGIQAFAMKFSNETMNAESIFFYMSIGGLSLAPIAYYMTNTDQPINYGWNGAFLAFMIHFLNATGALTLVYALRYGKAIIVVPLTGLSPVITIILSLIIYGVWPSAILYFGIAAAIAAMYLISE